MGGSKSAPAPTPEPPKPAPVPTPTATDPRRKAAAPGMDQSAETAKIAEQTAEAKLGDAPAAGQAIMTG